jgi:hypothetical protein
MEERDILITGYAKLPQGITATELYTIVAVGLVVNRDTGEIINSDCSLVTQVARDFVRMLVQGKSLKHIEDIEAVFNARYFGSARKALLCALHSCVGKFHQIHTEQD